MHKECRTLLGRDMLREQFSQLPQLEQRSIRILREIPFREQAEAQELLVVLRKVGKIGLDSCHIRNLLMVEGTYANQSSLPITPTPLIIKERGWSSHATQVHH